MEIVVSLAEAERDPLGRASSLAARDVRGVSGMDVAAERMAGLARRMFSPAKGECFPVCACFLFAVKSLRAFDRALPISFLTCPLTHSAHSA